jgi:hypothetical protein
LRDSVPNDCARGQRPKVVFWIDHMKRKLLWLRVVALVTCIVTSGISIQSYLEEFRLLHCYPMQLSCFAYRGRFFVVHETLHTGAYPVTCLWTIASMSCDPPAQQVICKIPLWPVLSVLFMLWAGHPIFSQCRRWWRRRKGLWVESAFPLREAPSSQRPNRGAPVPSRKHGPGETKHDSGR